MIGRIYNYYLGSDLVSLWLFRFWGLTSIGPKNDSVLLNDCDFHNFGDTIIIRIGLWVLFWWNGQTPNLDIFGVKNWWILNFLTFKTDQNLIFEPFWKDSLHLWHCNMVFKMSQLNWVGCFLVLENPAISSQVFGLRQNQSITIFHNFLEKEEVGVCGSSKRITSKKFENYKTFANYYLLLKVSWQAGC